ncbi:chorismate mutase [Gardnerella sp. KA00603]|uniref:chorismate mutase n=1 Tax=Gardnerella TaxID=2701 RepID=UPI0002634CBD|nr:chorismate mutase [Gardnerella vaginalis]EIK87488.1 chorismate mutase [Gardnerella vaginalis 6119V5]MBF9308355.1 chorismate mutase [Bifidobacteriaceae bacterium NR043]MBF9353940.1 chorismate mutase [Bifidobacteriaceae bacterium NR044]RFT39030.1 chorismate mutase [Bifidobacteriaceae bacterium NR003]
MCDFSETTINSSNTSLNKSCEDAADKILTLRKSIDNIDGAIIALLAERFKTTNRIGELKAKAKFAPLDSKREQEQVQRLLDLSAAAGLDESIALQYHKFVVTEAKKRHQKMQS